MQCHMCKWLSVPHDASCCSRPLHLYVCSRSLFTDNLHSSPGLSPKPSSTTLQRAREEEIEERKAMRRHERDVARKREFVRRVRVQIEERRAEVGGFPASCAVFVHTLHNHSCLGFPGGRSTV